VLILADEIIPRVKQAFGTLGNVRTMTGRDIRPANLKTVDILVVRSTTRVNADLIGDSPVRFVATATSGIDHVDTQFLAERGIGFAAAAGCNANSVAEYVVSALLAQSSMRQRPLAEQSLGVVGVGHVGRRVARYAKALGMDVLLNDPPRQRAEGGDFVSLDEVLAECDVVTLHVPFTLSGPDATVHLVGPGQLALMRDGATLINTSRGPVVDGPALQTALESKRLHAVIDTWPNEPNIDAELLRCVDLGTAHVAGYSADAKLAGTTMTYRAVCKHLGAEPKWSPEGLLPEPEPADGVIGSAEQDDESAVTWAVWRAYDVTHDDDELRRVLPMPAADRAAHFDRLRSEYPLRREFGAHTVRVHGQRTSLIETLAALGFRVRKV
jgi:erythronate-4-phosphate dehydrogenase